MSVTSAPVDAPATLSDVKPFGVRFRLKGVPWIPIVILALVLIGALGGEDLGGRRIGEQEVDQLGAGCGVLRAR